MRNYQSYKFWKNKNVFITGHTGFKGAWLSLILSKLGACIYGYSLKPKKNSLYNELNIKSFVKKSYLKDIRNFSDLKSSIDNVNPDIIFHLAAQPLVLDSYKKPIDTFDTNMIGTINLLESIRQKKRSKIKSAIIITTDKVYDTSRNRFFVETDRLGSSDPYSTSKACCELICNSYIKSFLSIKNIIATARAGNVLGGGDYAENRLVPDILKALKNSKVLKLRNPDHVRPWQHVFEPLYGYILLSEKLYLGKLKNIKPNWNFGPNNLSCKSVKFVAEEFKKKIPIKLQMLKKNNMKESSSLKLNNNKSKKLLNWKPKWSLKITISKIIEWDSYSKKNKLKISIQQINEYFRFKNK